MNDEPVVFRATAQQFACAMLLEAQIAHLHVAVNQLQQMGLKDEADELEMAITFVGRRKATIEMMWQQGPIPPPPPAR